ncbi:MAG: hypothetical protein WCX77_03395 [Candidatus Paceibacterota bacterium]|jgi:hypothetical protein
MVKKIFLTLLLLGFIFNPLAAERASAVSSSEIQNIASSTQESIKKDVLPAWQQCFQSVKTFFVQIKDFISEKIKAFDLNKIISGIKEEFNREAGEFKKDLPGTFKGLIEWFKTFSDNWFKKP